MIKVEIINNTAMIRLNRPDKRNSLNPELILALKNQLDKLENNSSVKVIILTGEGSAFCSGADLNYLQQLKDYSIIENKIDSENIAELLLKIYRFPKPVIAAVNGPAVAGGCGLASVCDFIIADRKNARFGYPEVKIGFVPAIVSIFLIRRIGEGRAKEFLLTGEIFDADESFKKGLVNQVSDDIIADSIQFAAKLYNNSALSMKLTKELINNIGDLNLDSAIRLAVNQNVISRSSEDFIKGISIFLNIK
ncbi:MAG: enoyl-CoA hydratase/isomerase family protein [Ignavibacteriales bacterium]|nr:enoyl-CoA hydratase/isomerase family protein [Ignavibacteriales bacterium]